MSNPVDQLKELLHDQPTNPLRPHQVSEYTEELNRVRAVAGGLDMEGKTQPWMPGDKGGARRKVQQIQKILHEQAPKPITDARRDKVAKLAGETIEGVIQPALLSEAEMRRNPAGAVGRALKGEFSKGVKDAVLTVRRALLGLDPDNDDPDYTNMERFRPSGILPNGASTFMPDAQMPGVFAMTTVAKANWPEGMPAQGTVNSPLTQARQHAAKPRRSEAERKAWGAKMKAAKEARRPVPTAAIEPESETAPA